MWKFLAGFYVAGWLCLFLAQEGIGFVVGQHVSAEKHVECFINACTWPFWACYLIVRLLTEELP